MEIEENERERGSRVRDREDRETGQGRPPNLAQICLWTPPPQNGVNYPPFFLRIFSKIWGFFSLRIFEVFLRKFFLKTLRFSFWEKKKKQKNERFCRESHFWEFLRNFSQKLEKKFLRKFWEFLRIFFLPKKMVDLGLGFSIGGKFEGFLRFLSSQKDQENWR